MLVLASGMVLDRLAAARREGMIALSFGGVGLGIAVSGLVAAAPDGGWRLPWIALGLGSGLLAVPVWMLVTDPAARTDAAAAAPERALPRPLWLLAAAYFAEGAGYIVSATFLVAILARLPETAEVARAAWILVGVAGVAASPLWGWLATRTGPRAALALAHMVQAAAIVLPAALPSGWAALLGAVGFGGTFMAITALTFALARRVAPAHAGRSIGMLTVAFAVGQMVAPWPAGLILERTGSAALPLALAAATVALGAALVVGVRTPQEPGERVRRA
jgi:predicted MFS family arabinose efflux permease